MKTFIWLKLSLVSLVFIKGSPMTISSGNKENITTGFSVIELFTSEGCSSCPAADKAVAEINKKYPDNVYVLSFHVDYWNYLGWKDEFSDPAYSARQQQYASVFNLSSIYTPQVIVNGKKEFVGSDKPLLEKTISNEINTTNNISFTIDAGSADAKTVKINYTVDGNSAMLLNVALVQVNAETNVKRGENRGLILRHINIVRGFNSVALNKANSGTMRFEIPPGLFKKDCMIIAYLQDKTNSQILGARQTVIH